MTMENDLVARLRLGEAVTPGYEVVWVQNLRAHFTDGMFGRKVFPEWNDIFLENVNSLLTAASEAASRIQALEAELARKTEALEFIDLLGPGNTLGDARQVARSALEEKTDV